MISKCNGEWGKVRIMQRKEVVVWLVIASIVAPATVLIQQTYAQEPERKQVIYNTIVTWYEKHNNQPPPTEKIIQWTKKILEEEEFSGHVFTTSEIEQKALYELQLELAEGAASFTDMLTK